MRKLVVFLAFNSPASLVFRGRTVYVANLGLSMADRKS
jgi:hypothetical protein